MNALIKQLDLPDQTSPVQFFATPGYTAQQRLMWAMLDGAISDLDLHRRTPTKRAKRLATEAREWIFRDESTYSHSFVSICHYLNIDSDYLRAGLVEKYAL